MNQVRTRPYKALNLKTKQVRMIEGSSVAQVAKHIITNEWLIEPVGGMEAVRLIADEAVTLESAVVVVPAAL